MPDSRIYKYTVRAAADLAANASNQTSLWVPCKGASMVVFRFKSTGTAVLASAYAEVGNDSAGGLGLSTAAQGYLTRGVASGAGNRLNAGEGLAIAIYNQDASRPFKELYCRAFFSNSTVKVDMLEILAEVYYETGLSQSSGQAFVAV